MEEKSFTIYIVSGFPARAKLLVRALKSALSQDYQNYNIVLRVAYHDDEISNLCDDRVIVSYFDSDKISVGHRLGQNIADSLKYFNDFVSFLDDDDYFTRDKLKTVNSVFDQNIVYIHNDSSATDVSGKLINFTNTRDDFNMSSISVDKRIIDEDFFRNLDSSVDTGIYLCALKYGNLKFIKQKLTYYTLHRSTTMGYSGNFEDWRKLKLHSYKDIIQPTYEYMSNYFKGTKASKYVNRLLVRNRIFMELYGGNKSVNLFTKLIAVLSKPYFDSRDWFSNKVILASIISKERTLRRLYRNDVAFNEKFN